MDKRKSISGILIVCLLAVVLFMNFASAPGTVSKVEIKDKRDEIFYVVPGTEFCVERTLRNKDIDNISPVIVPLFSEGATLKSIDVKHVTEETYFEDVPDYGTCQREVIKRFDYDEAKCNSLEYTWNTSSCHQEVNEDYSCITGHHQEQRTREVVAYEPILGGQYKDGEDSNDDEYVVEIFRGGLPDDVKALKNIGYSTSFDLEDEATIRMCFRAPEFGSEITSGQISYLTYYGSGYDYESSSWWNSSWKQRYRITISNTDGIAHEHEIIKLNISDSTCYEVIANINSTRIMYNNSGTWDSTDFEWYNQTKEELFFINNVSNSAGGSNEQYWLYCNTSSSQVDFGNVSIFAWRDDFEDNDVTDWTVSGGSFVASASADYEGAYGGAGTSTPNVYYGFTDPAADVYFVWYQNAVDDYSGSGVYIEEDGSNKFYATTRVHLSEDTFGYYDGVGERWTGDFGTHDTWYAHKYFVLDGGVNADWWIDNGTVIYYNRTADYGTCDNPDTFRIDDGCTTTHVDYIFMGTRNMTIYLTPSTITLGPEDTNQNESGGGDTNATIKLNSGNLIFTPGSGNIQMNGSLDVSGDFLWIEDNSCPGGEVVHAISTIGVLDCVSAGSSSEEIQDACGSMATDGTGVDFTYNDAGNTLTPSFDCSDVTDSANDHLTCSGEDIVVSDDWVDISGDTMSSALYIDDVSDNPQLRLIDQSDEYFFLDKFKSGDARLLVSDSRSIYFDASAVYPASDNATDLGKSTKRWKHFYAVNQTIGDLKEEYIENPNYDYEVGDVVAMDLSSEYEIRPLMDLSDRIIGAVSELPHDVIEEECDETGCYNVTYPIDMSISIYGKFSPVKVKGIIHVGDYLVASDEPGVVTSMYDKEHPVTPSLFKKSKKKNEYNLHAKMLPTLGIAMDEYDSAEVGTIKVVLGK